METQTHNIVVDRSARLSPLTRTCSNNKSEKVWVHIILSKFTVFKEASLHTHSYWHLVNWSCETSSETPQKSWGKFCQIWKDVRICVVRTKNLEKSPLHINMAKTTLHWPKQNFKHMMKKKCLLQTTACRLSRWIYTVPLVSYGKLNSHTNWKKVSDPVNAVNVNLKGPKFQCLNVPYLLVCIATVIRLLGDGRGAGKYFLNTARTEKTVQNMDLIEGFVFKRQWPLQQQICMQGAALWPTNWQTAHITVYRDHKMHQTSGLMF